MSFHNKGLLGEGSSPGTPLTLDDEEGTRKKLRTLSSDPLSRDLGDPEFMEFKTKQFERAYPGKQKLDASGRAIDSPPVVKDIEPFKPKVKRRDLDFGAPVGAGKTAKNDLTDLIGAKRGLSNTKLFAFDVTRERSDEAGKSFIDSVKRFQTNRGLKIDGLMNPEGPTVKALRGLLFPPGTASNVGQPVDLSRAIAIKPPGAVQPRERLLSANAPGGQPKAATPRAALGDAPPDKPAKPGPSPDEEVEMAVHLRPPKGPGGRGLGKSPIPPMSKVVKEILDKIPSIKPPKGGPVKAKKPAGIIVYPDGRLYLATDPDTGKPNVTSGDKVFLYDKPFDVKFARDNINKNLPPSKNDKGKTDGGKAREESFVVVEKPGEDGVIRQWMLIDPKSGQPLRAPHRNSVVLTPEQVLEMGLSDMDTSRREGPGFDEFMQVMQEFGKDVLGEVLKRLFGKRGTRR